MTFRQKGLGSPHRAAWRKNCPTIHIWQLTFIITTDVPYYETMIQELNESD